MTVLLLPFQFGCLPFLPLVWLLWRGLPVLCCIRAESGHSCLVPNLKGNTSSSCPLKMMLAVGLSSMAFIMLRYVPSIPTLLRVFIVNGCWILSNASPPSIDVIMWFLSFILFLWCITFIDLQILHQPCIPRINPTWSWLMIFLMYCWIQFAMLFWGF